MEDSVKERLKLFLRNYNIKAVDFCRSIGVSSGFISGMRESIQPDKLKSIAINYPCLDIGWLLTGIGEMEKVESSNSLLIEELKAEIEKYIRYYNEKRIKEKLGWLSPVQYRLSLLVA